MKLLHKEDTKIIREFLKIPIPKYIREYNNELFDLMDCYEVAFTFANDILRGRKINPHTSPWGNGRSVIFDPCYTALLLDIKRSNPGTDIENYCRVFLDVLNIFRLYFV